MKKKALLVTTAIAIVISCVAASSASGFSLGTTTRCTFQSGAQGLPGYNSAITICVVDTYTLIGPTTGGCLYTGQETIYVFLGNAGAGPVLERGAGPDFVYMIYGAFRPGSPLKVFPNGAANPYVGSTFTFGNPCPS